jgi:hypothetical protein
MIQIYFLKAKYLFKVYILNFSSHLKGVINFHKYSKIGLFQLNCYIKKNSRQSFKTFPKNYKNIKTILNLLETIKLTF